MLIYTFYFGYEENCTPLTYNVHGTSNKEVLNIFNEFNSEAPRPIDCSRASACRMEKGRETLLTAKHCGKFPSVLKKGCLI